MAALYQQLLFSTSTTNMFRSSAYTLLWILFSVFGVVRCEPSTNQISLSKRATIDLAITANFPDPSIIKVNGTWYAFATHTRGSTGPKIQVAQSINFEDWSVVKNADGSQFDALPVLPAWVRMANFLTWAPDVSQLVGLLYPQMSPYLLTFTFRTMVPSSCTIRRLQRLDQMDQSIALALPHRQRFLVHIQHWLKPYSARCLEEVPSMPPASRTGMASDMSCIRSRWRLREYCCTYRRYATDAPAGGC
jgi:hypothetical protein